MKYLFLLLVILAVLWAIQRGQNRNKPVSRKDSAPATPANMVSCAHCGIHLPQEEAVKGEKGLYCGTEHRAAAQDHNPA